MFTSFTFRTLRVRRCGEPGCSAGRAFSPARRLSDAHCNIQSFVSSVDIFDFCSVVILGELVWNDPIAHHANQI